MLSQQTKKFIEYQIPAGRRSLLSLTQNYQFNEAHRSSLPPSISRNSDQKLSNPGSSQKSSQKESKKSYKQSISSSEESSSSDNGLTSVEKIHFRVESDANLEIKNFVQKQQISDKDKDSYLQMILEIQDRFSHQNQTSRQGSRKGTRKSTIQKTILHALNKVHNQQIDSADNLDSISEGEYNALPNVVKQRRSPKVSLLVDHLMKEFLFELDRVSDEVNSFYTVSEGQSQSQSDINIDRMEKRYKRRVKEMQPSYNLYLVHRFDLLWLDKEFLIYKDKYPLLSFRKKIVYSFNFISQIALDIITHQLFLLFVSASILVNVITFVIYDAHNISANIIILILYAIEVGLKLLGLGILQYLEDTWNIIDLLILTAYFLHNVDSSIIGVDFTPIRLVRILYIVGLYFKRLQIMIISIQESLKFIKEVIAIVLIFTTFFALSGLHLFNGLFRMRCHDELGIYEEQLCGYDHCHYYCAHTAHNPEIPTHFDNFLYSYGQIMRVMIFNNWTDPTYFSMRTFHPSAVILYILVVFIAGIFCINLIIAVVKIYYSQTMKKYEFANIESNSTEDRINLNELKQSHIWTQLKLLQLDFVYKQFTRTSLQVIDLDKSQKTKTLRKYLSARQKNEAEHLEEYTVNIKKMLFSTKHLLLPSDRFDKEVQQLTERYKIKLSGAVYQMLLQYPFLGWRIQVSFDPYNSTSAFDVFDKKSKDIKLRNKKEEQHKLVRRGHPKQYFLIKDKEIQNYIEETKSKPQIQNVIKIPIRLNHRIQRNFSPAHSNYEMINSPFRQDFQIEMTRPIMHNKEPLSHSQIICQQFIYLNGQQYNYEEVMILIDREVSDQVAQTEDFEDLYLELRLREYQQQVITCKNNSSDNVLKLDLYKKGLIFKQLNNLNKNHWISGFKGIAKVIQSEIILLLRNKGVENLFDFLILVNIVCLCLYGLYEEYLIRYMNRVIVLLLFIEFTLKLLANHRLRWTLVLDGCIILTAFIEVLIFQVNESIEIMIAFQAILFYRIIQYNRFAVQIALIIEQSINSFFNLIVLLIFVMTVFALVGMNIFINDFPINTETGQLNAFNDLAMSFMVVFKISTMDDWYGLVVEGTTHAKSTQTMIYCLVLIYILNFMTFGLVFAIILDGFSNYQVEQEDMISPKIKNLNSEVSDKIKELHQEMPKLTTQKKTQKSDFHVLPVTTMRRSIKDFLKSMMTINDFRYFGNHECQYSLMLFDQSNEFRRLMYRISLMKSYKILINITILASILNMAYSTYDENQLTKSFEFFLNIILLIASIIKIITYGVLKDNGALFNDIWRSIDTLYLISYFITSDHPVLELLHRLKYIRPMRFLTIIKQMREMKYALDKSVPDLINIFFVQLMVWFIFAIFGTIIYKQQFGYCEEIVNFHVGKDECTAQGKHWVNYVHNYDTIYNSMSTLYVLATGDPWGEIFQISYNSNKSQYGPTPLNNRTISYLFYFCFIMIGSLFFTGFFTGILFINFKNNRNKLINKNLSEEQVLFKEVAHLILEETPQYSSPPKTAIRKMAARLISDKNYQKLMKPALVLQALILSLIYFDAELDYLQDVNTAYYCLSFLILFDTLMKMLAYGIVRYWGYSWRKLEFILTVLSLCDFIIDQTTGWTTVYFKSTPNDAYFVPIRVFFTLRNVRLLLIIQEFKGLSRLLRILYYSLPFLAKILMLYLTILSSYALLGCDLFGDINKGTLIDDYLNFTDFPKALLTLFKCSTKNEWRVIMVDCTNLNPYCSSDPTQCGRSWVVVILYYYSFILIQGFIVLNLFILALVEQFEDFYNSQNNVLQTYIENIDRFRTIWSKYSSEMKGRMMHTRYLAHFLLELGPPLGNKVGDNVWDAAYDAFNFHLLANQEGYVQFNEVLYETIKFVYKDEVFHEGSKLALHEMKEYDKNCRRRLHPNTSLEQSRGKSTRDVQVKGNFNILQDYIFVLTAFRTWAAFEQSLRNQADFKQDAYSESVASERNYNNDDSQKAEVLGRSLASSCDDQPKISIYHQIEIPFQIRTNREDRKLLLIPRKGV